ncbi:MAG: energy-coupling factor transporter ATPase [Clostridiales bacterium]|nr:energy-coupling factor transporter ATPase [Candidatus Crickella caballi]
MRQSFSQVRYTEISNFIEVKNLIIDYTRVDDEGRTVLATRAVNDVSFTVEKGSFISVVGMNGSGKSTMAKALNGLLLPSKGEVIVDGMSTADEDRIWEIRSRVGMVFQNPDNQIVSSIVEDDVAFGPENIGVPSEEIRKRVDSALRKVDMYDCKDKGAHMLSGGQKQRIAIAGAIAMRPQCIVFDEPTAMLDPRGRKQVMEIIHELNEDGITCILITHFMEEAAQADRVIVMKEGQIYSDTTPEELFSDRKLIEGAGLEMPPLIDLRDRAGLPESITTIEDMICQLK